MAFDIKIGVENVVEKSVVFDDTAAKYGSGLLEIFSTPALLALMEDASYHAVLPYIPEEYTTVGMEVNIKHLKAVPIGGKVRGKAVLTKMERNKLTFDVIAFDGENNIIGEGTHTRYIIEIKRFLKQFQS